MTDNTARFKIVVLGNLGTGKTSIVARYTNGTWEPSYKPTVGVDFALKIIQKEDWIIHAQLWDVAGQERFGAMTSVYYKGASGAIIVFDLLEHDSFGALEKWLESLMSHVRYCSDAGIPVMILGNKNDLVDGDVGVGDEEIEALMEKYSDYMKCWYRVSAKTGENIEAAMEFFIDLLVKNYKPPVVKNTANIGDRDEEEQGGCCLGG